MYNYNVLTSPYGNKYWYRDGGLHREGGPACEYADGSRRWFLDGCEYSEPEYWHRYNCCYPSGCCDHDYVYGDCDHDHYPYYD